MGRVRCQLCQMQAEWAIDMVLLPRFALEKVRREIITAQTASAPQVVFDVLHCLYTCSLMNKENVAATFPSVCSVRIKPERGYCTCLVHIDDYLEANGLLSYRVRCIPAHAAEPNVDEQEISFS